MDVNKAIDKQALGLVGVSRGRGGTNVSGWTGHGYYNTDGFYNWGSNHPQCIGLHNNQREWMTSQQQTSWYPAYYEASSPSSDGFGGRYGYGKNIESYGSACDLPSTSGGPIRSYTSSISTGSNGGYRTVPYRNNNGTGRGKETSSGNVNGGIRGRKIEK